MPGKTKCSESRKANYKAYEASKQAEKNKECKILRHMLKHPNDKQTEQRTVPVYKKPKVNMI